MQQAAANALAVIGLHDPERLLREVVLSEAESDAHKPLRVLARAHPDGLAVLARVLRGEVNVYKGPVMVACVLTGWPNDNPVEPTAEEAAVLVPVLIEALDGSRSKHDFDHVTTNLAGALAAMGEPGRAAIPMLRGILAEIGDDPERLFVRGVIARSLARLDG